MNDDLLSVKGEHTNTVKPVLGSVLVVLDEAFYRKADELYCALNWWRFADQLAVHCENLTLFVPISDQFCPENARLIKPKRLTICGRFFFQNIEQYYRRILSEKAQLLSTARELFDRHDLIIFRTPNPSAMLLARLAWKMKKPTVMLVAGNVITQTKYATQRTIKAMIARFVSRRLRKMELNIAEKSALVAVWGRELLSVYSGANSKIAVAASPSISRHQIFRRDDSCTGSVIKLLRVSRVLPSKGIEYLLKAVASLRSRGHDIRLDIAGGTDEQAYVDSLLALAHNSGISDYVKFHGQIEFGQPLFELFRNADIHIISSLGEGLPRCIAEARAFGLPTIATNVGGVPSVVHHEKDGLLIQPKNVEQIVNSVERIIEESSLRGSIINEGYRLAEMETLEFQAERLAGLMAKALSGKVMGRELSDIHLL